MRIILFKSEELVRSHHVNETVLELELLSPSITSPLRVVMALSSPLGLATVLLGRDPDPEVEALFICKRLAIIFLISFVLFAKEV
nr:hypothetical protein [Tanacetum cinerariifolium]